MANKKKPGVLAHVLAVVAVGGIGFLGIKSCHDIVSTSPEEAERQEQAEEIVWASEEAKQPERMRLINRLIEEGAFRKVEFEVMLATIWIDDTFYLLEFDYKQNFCSVVYAYLVAKERNKIVYVDLRDTHSGKVVGKVRHYKLEMN